MAKGDKSFHAIGLALLIAFFGWLAFSDNLASIPSINAILHAYKFIFLMIIVVLALPTIFGLILDARSNGGEYDDRPYYNFLKAIIHLIFVIVVTLIFAVIFIYLYIFGSLFMWKWLSWVLSGVITLSLFVLFWIWIEKKFNKKILGFLSYR